MNQIEELEIMFNDFMEKITFLSGFREAYIIANEGKYILDKINQIKNCIDKQNKDGKDNV